jgi:hypothetical protein
MTFPTRQKRQRLGIVMAVISLVAMATFVLADLFRGQWHFEGAGATADAAWAEYSVRGGVNGYYLVPMVLCGVIGVACCLWPAQKPPKLSDKQ